MLTINFTQYIPGVSIQDVRRNQQLYRRVYEEALRERVNTIRRARIRFSFNGLGMGPTMAPTTFINTSMPTQNISISTNDNRRLQSSELKLYEEETNENRQLQTDSSRLEICLRKYSRVVQITEQIIVPVPNDTTPSDYRLILESLLNDTDYMRSIMRLA